MIVKIGYNNGSFVVVDGVEHTRYYGDVRSITGFEMKQKGNHCIEFCDLTNIEVIYLCNDDGKTVDTLYPKNLHDQGGIVESCK